MAIVVLSTIVNVSVHFLLHIFRVFYFITNFCGSWWQLHYGRERWRVAYYLQQIAGQPHFFHSVLSFYLNIVVAFGYCCRSSKRNWPWKMTIIDLSWVFFSFHLRTRCMQIYIYSAVVCCWNEVHSLQVIQTTEWMDKYVLWPYHEKIHTLLTGKWINYTMAMGQLANKQYLLIVLVEWVTKWIHFCVWVSAMMLVSLLHLHIFICRMM